MISLEQIKQEQEKLNQMISDYEKQRAGKKESGWCSETGDHVKHYYVKNDNSIFSCLRTCAKDLETLNTFKTKEKAEEIAFKQLLFRKLQKFADENDDKIDWNDTETGKFSICYDYNDLKLNTYGYNYMRYANQVYFNSVEFANQAIELFKDDLIRYFTEY